MTPALAPTLTLSNGVRMPQIGLGTWPMNDAQAAVAVAQAIRLGFRLIDTAENYRNEEGVGEGLRRSGVARDALFVTTKFNREWHSLAGPRAACEASLKRLDLDHVDLLLIHWPNPDQDRYVEAFEGLKRVLDAGLTRAIGVSNFKPAHLQRLFNAGFTPPVNQIQLDPNPRRDDLVALHRARGIVTEAWSPIDRGGELMSAPVVLDIAQRLHRTPAQIVLRWHVQNGFAPIPKSSDVARQAANLDIFGFALDEADIAALDALPQRPIQLDADSFGH